MNQNDIGQFYTTNGEDIWQLIIYSNQPTATMRNVETKERIGGVVGSPILKPFKKLVVQKEE